MDDDRLVTYSSHRRLAQVRLNRPQHGNRLAFHMMTELVGALTAAASSGADVLTITAAGADFCLGRDGEERLPDGVTRADNLGLIVAANAALTVFPGLSLAAVQGRAFGFGCGLAVQADITLASRTATFAFDESRKGRPPRFVMGYLADYIGPKRALDLVATGRVLNATTAEDFGIVTRVVSPDDLTSATSEMAQTLLELDRDALHTCKAYPREVRGLPWDERGEYALRQTVGSVRA